MTTDSLLNLTAVFLLLAILLAAIHAVERFTQRCLMRWLGWRAIMITGWLGTPIHELSHALACWIFGHRIDELRLFAPDERTGKLGYVKHSYRAGNLWQELGTVVIATAPLVGGSLALLGLVALFYPHVLWEAWTASNMTAPGTIDPEPLTWYSVVSQVVSGILSWSHWGTVRLWVFLYLVLCVGCHWAPSQSDYLGATRGALLLVVIVFALGLFFYFVPAAGATAVQGMIAVGSMLVALGSLSLSLIVVAAALVWGISSLFSWPRHE